MPESRVSVLVRNLSYRSSPDDVKRVFGKFGEIRDVYLPLDYFTGRPRGFGFIEFLQGESASEALSMDGEEVDGNRIQVVMAQEKRKTPETMARITSSNGRPRGENGGEMHREEEDYYGRHRGRDRYRDLDRNQDREREKGRDRDRDRGKRTERWRSRSRSRSGSRPRPRSSSHERRRRSSHRCESTRKGRRGDRSSSRNRYRSRSP